MIEYTEDFGSSDYDSPVTRWADAQSAVTDFSTSGQIFIGATLETPMTGGGGGGDPMANKIKKKIIALKKKILAEPDKEKQAELIQDFFKDNVQGSKGKGSKYAKYASMMGLAAISMAHSAGLTEVLDNQTGIGGVLAQMAKSGMSMGESAMVNLMKDETGIDPTDSIRNIVLKNAREQKMPDDLYLELRELTKGKTIAQIRDIIQYDPRFSKDYSFRIQQYGMLESLVGKNGARAVDRVTELGKQYPNEAGYLAKEGAKLGWSTAKGIASLGWSALRGGASMLA